MYKAMNTRPLPKESSLRKGCSIPDPIVVSSVVDFIPNVHLLTSHDQRPHLEWFGQKLASVLEMKGRGTERRTKWNLAILIQ